MQSSSFAEGFMTALAFLELIVIIAGVCWAVLTHRRVNALDREVSWLKGRTAAPDAVRISDPVAGKVYDVSAGNIALQRPTRRP